MKRALAISVIDQGVLSAQSLLISLVLIRMAEGDAVGRFALAMAIYFALLVVQDALAGSILANRVFARPAEEQRDVIRIVSTIAMVVLMAGSVLVTLAATAWLDFDLNLTLAAIAMVVGGLSREHARAVSVVTDDMRRCVTIDSVAAIGSLALLPVLWRFNAPEAACLWSIAIAHGGAALFFGPQLHVNPLRVRDALQRYGALFRLTRWNLVTGLSSEIQSRTFLFLIEAFRGLIATATLHVGRLIISPVILITMAIGRIVLPRMAHHIHQGRPEAAYSIIRQTAFLLLAIALAYCVAVLAALPLLDQYLFRGQYPGIVQTMYAWCAYAVFTVPLWCLSWLYRALERFRELAIVNLFDTLFVILAMGCLLLPVPLHVAVVVLIVSDVIVGVVLVRKLANSRSLWRTAS